MNLETLIADHRRDGDRAMAVFALLNLGVIESLANGIVSASDAVRAFYTAANCLFVRRRLKNKIADEVMSRGVQLPDLFDILPAEESHREFQRELAVMRSLGHKLLGKKRLVA
jgi:hypothetical protein